MTKLTPNCPVCNEPMEYLGNVSGVVLTSYPPQWNDTYVCRTHKTKRTVRVHAPMPESQIDLSHYKEIKTTLDKEN